MASRPVAITAAPRDHTAQLGDAGLDAPELHEVALRLLADPLPVVDLSKVARAR